MARTKEQIAETARINRETKIKEAKDAVFNNQSLRGYLSAQRHPFDNHNPTSTSERSLLTYYEWAFTKARHYKQYEIAIDVLKLPVSRYKKTS